MKKLAIFDVCGTIFDGNSTEWYLEMLTKKGIISKNRLKLITLIPRKIFTIFFLLFNFDFHRFLIGQMMRGVQQKNIKPYENEIQKAYFERLTRLHFIHKYFEDTNTKIVLLSASIQEPIIFLGNQLKISFFSSKLRQKNEIYTGGFEIDLLGNKESIFKNKKIDLATFDEIELYTDNESDIGLITYLHDLNKKIKVFIIPYAHTQYWQDFFIRNNTISYEFIS